MTSFLASLPPSILKKKARTPEQLMATVKSSLIFILTIHGKKSNTVDDDSINFEYNSNTNSGKISEINNDGEKMLMWSLT